MGWIWSVPEELYADERFLPGLVGLTGWGGVDLSVAFGATPDFVVTPPLPHLDTQQHKSRPLLFRYLPRGLIVFRGSFYFWLPSLSTGPFDHRPT